MKTKGRFGSYIDELLRLTLANPKPGKKGWNADWHFKHRDADGNILWEGVNPNNLADEGEKSVLETYLRGSAAPGTFYLRLFGDTPVDTDTISTLLNEPAGSGYAAKAVFRGTGTDGCPNLVLAGTDYCASSGTFQFTCNSGSWGPVTYAAMTTVGTGTSGLLISYVALSGSRILQLNDTLDVAIQVSLG